MHIFCRVSSTCASLPLFQGTILKVPEKASEPVPIKLQFERRRDLECTKDDSECFEQTWQKIQEIVEVSNGKENSIKYLHNFTYILKAVLERDSHLFSEEEIMFLGVLTSLMTFFLFLWRLWFSCLA